MVQKRAFTQPPSYPQPLPQYIPSYRPCPSYCADSVQLNITSIQTQQFLYESFYNAMLDGCDDDDNNNNNNNNNRGRNK
jgi:hypothetical protein